jgi:hypothetical protein
MTPALQLAIYQMIASIGIDATVAIMNGIKNATTIDDAIAALQAAQKIGWKEAKEGTLL